MDYQPISDHAQLQLLEGLGRMLLHGVLLAVVGASAVLLCLCIGALRLTRRPPSEAEELGWRRSGSSLSEARCGGPVHSLAATRLWDMETKLSGRSISDKAAPMLTAGGD